MSTPALPPNPSLVAIMLIARTRKGVKRIFHFPPNPGKEKSHIKPDHDDSSADESSSNSDDDYSSVEDEDLDDNTGFRHRNGPADIDESGSASPEKAHGDDSWRQSEEDRRRNFLALPYGFERLLCPPATFHKKRFEMTINGLTFLGWPVFAHENGEWKRRRKSRSAKDKANRMSTISEQQLSNASEINPAEESIDDVTAIESTEDEHEVSNGNDFTKFDPHSIAIDEVDETSDAADTPQKDLSMFHMVFVMNPPPLEYQLRLDEMYRYVVKKFSRALKWEQARSHYVQKECEKLKVLKAKLESSSDNAIRNSSLARAIASVYSAISTSRIAHVELTTHLTFSLQIPTPTSISYLPDLVSPQLPGLWLTTATNIPSDEDLHATRSKLASHFALLLLSDLSTILSDIASTSTPLAAPLANYLRQTTPRKSFLQVSQASGIPLADIHFLASHLIYWRRARAVPPLHQRDIYIVSPNADMRKLRSATQSYAKVFPAQIPSLTKMLSLLSAGPRPFSSVIPSKDHKPIYFEVLAWLLRGGWVTQLRSFGWVRVPATIQAGVAREEGEMAAEIGNSGNEADPVRVGTLGKSSGLKQGSSRDSRTGSGSEVSQSSGSNASIRSIGQVMSPDADPPDVAIRTLDAPSLQRSRSRSRSASSLSSARTAIPVTTESAHTAGTIEASPSTSVGAVTSGAPVPSAAAPVEAFAPILLLAPTRASGRESRYLAHIARAMEVSEGREVRECWERCLKYFNGEHALEKIAMREGWKRKKVETMRATWVRLGVLLEGRYW